MHVMTIPWVSPRGTRRPIPIRRPFYLSINSDFHKAYHSYLFCDAKSVPVYIKHATSPTNEYGSLMSAKRACACGAMSEDAMKHTGISSSARTRAILFNPLTTFYHVPSEDRKRIRRRRPTHLDSSVNLVFNYGHPLHYARCVMD
jgi:hypothetical protein